MESETANKEKATVFAKDISDKQTVIHNTQKEHLKFSR